MGISKTQPNSPKNGHKWLKWLKEKDRILKDWIRLMGGSNGSNERRTSSSTNM